MICPSCLTKYPSDARKCASDGTDLLPDEALATIDRELSAGDTVGEYKIEYQRLLVPAEALRFRSTVSLQA